MSFGRAEFSLGEVSSNWSNKVSIYSSSEKWKCVDTAIICPNYQEVNTVSVFLTHFAYGLFQSTKIIIILLLLINNYFAI